MSSYQYHIINQPSTSNNGYRIVLHVARCRTIPDLRLFSASKLGGTNNVYHHPSLHHRAAAVAVFIIIICQICQETVSQGKRASVKGVNPSVPH